jgi:hypothetical protein
MIETSKPAATNNPARRWGVARLILSLWVALALPGAAAVSCGGATTSHSGTDTSTDWLRSCLGEVGQVVTLPWGDGPPEPLF